MKRLTLIRHAKSDWSDVTLSDFDRILNERGKKAASKMGKRMAKRGYIPDLFLSSSAKRAAETARIIVRELEIPKNTIVYQTKIFEAKKKTLIKLVGNLPKKEHIAIVGHNPGLSELAEWFCLEVPGLLPTCAILTLDLDIEDWKKINQGCGYILNYDYPKKSA